MSSKSVGFWLWAWQPPQSLRISPGRSWCQVWAMFSTMPFLSSVWNVKATSAGILARKLVSGLPSGSIGCSLPAVANLRTGISPRMRSRSLAWLQNVPAATSGPRWRSVVGSITRMRMAWMSSLVYRPASAPWLNQLSETPSSAGVERVEALIAAGASLAAGEGRRHAARRHHAVGIALALVQAGRADQAERRPLRQVRRQLAVVGQRAQALRLVDAVDALVRHQGARPLLVVVRIVLDQQHLARLVDRLAVLDQVDAAVDRRADGPCTVVDRAGRPDGQQVVVRRAGRMRELADARAESCWPRIGEVGRPFVGAGERRQRLDAERAERQAAHARLAVVEPAAAQRRVARVAQCSRAERRVAVRRRSGGSLTKVPKPLLFWL